MTVSMTNGSSGGPPRSKEPRDSSPLWVAYHTSSTQHINVLESIVRQLLEEQAMSIQETLDRFSLRLGVMEEEVIGSSIATPRLSRISSAGSDCETEEPEGQLPAQRAVGIASLWDMERSKEEQKGVVDRWTGVVQSYSKTTSRGWRVTYRPKTEAILDRSTCAIMTIQAWWRHALARRRDAMQASNAINSQDAAKDGAAKSPTDAARLRMNRSFTSKLGVGPRKTLIQRQPTGLRGVVTAAAAGGKLGGPAAVLAGLASRVDKLEQLALHSPGGRRRDTLVKKPAGREKLNDPMPNEAADLSKELFALEKQLAKTDADAKAALEGLASLEEAVHAAQGIAAGASQPVVRNSAQGVRASMATDRQPQGGQQETAAAASVLLRHSVKVLKHELRSCYVSYNAAMADVNLGQQLRDARRRDAAQAALQDLVELTAKTSHSLELWMGDPVATADDLAGGGERYVREQVLADPDGTAAPAASAAAAPKSTLSKPPNASSSLPAAAAALTAAALAQLGAQRPMSPDGLSMECTFAEGLAALLSALKACLDGCTSTGELAVRLSVAVSDLAAFARSTCSAEHEFTVEHQGKLESQVLAMAGQHDTLQRSLHLLISEVENDVARREAVKGLEGAVLDLRKAYEMVKAEMGNKAGADELQASLQDMAQKLQGAVAPQVLTLTLTSILILILSRFLIGTKCLACNRPFASSYQSLFTAHTNTHGMALANGTAWYPGVKPRPAAKGDRVLEPLDYITSRPKGQTQAVVTPATLIGESGAEAADASDASTVVSGASQPFAVGDDRPPPPAFGTTVLVFNKADAVSALKGVRGGALETRGDGGSSSSSSAQQLRPRGGSTGSMPQHHSDLPMPLDDGMGLVVSKYSRLMPLSPPRQALPQHKLLPVAAATTAHSPLTAKGGAAGGGSPLVKGGNGGSPGVPYAFDAAGGGLVVGGVAGAARQPQVPETLSEGW
ncbi:hypothetical protein JKP88DRAFT_250195 [Tribonema minus]|uniref:Uncharacterized protein n=1 Tax=Tribonema minus TaxID=303371 RepID=A0A836C707_9STRA|nr:hypothetical protein JKP88DRAFT_250195 [Tribonema minus]